MTKSKRKNKGSAEVGDGVLDRAYPQLSQLAHEAGTSLDDLGGPTPELSIKYQGLAEACFQVRTEVPRSSRPDAYGYLATVEAFLGRGILGGRPRDRRKFWSKLSAPGNSFLDTVAETAWAAHFADKPVPVRTDVLFDPADRDSKDADLVVTLEGKEWWLDVKSVQPENSEVFPLWDGPAPSFDDEDASLEPGGDSFALLSSDQIVSMLADRAAYKYQEKFGEAVAKGPLAQSPVGVLLCVLKWEQCIPMIETPQPDAPPKLFSDCPNLAVAWVHTFSKSQDTDLLRPYVVLRWARTAPSGTCQPAVQGRRQASPS